LIVNEKLKLKVMSENYLLTINGALLYHRFSEWYVYLNGELYEFPNGVSKTITSVINRLQEIKVKQDVLPILASYILYHNEQKTTAILKLFQEQRVFKKKNSQAAYFSANCGLLHYLVNKGHPKTIDFIEDCLNQDIKIKCKTVRELAIYIDRPATADCINCKWGKKYGRCGKLL